MKDIHRENAPTNESHVFTKSVNMDILVARTLNEIFITGSFTEIKFSKKRQLVAKPRSCVGPFCTPHSICLNIGF